MTTMTFEDVIPDAVPDLADVEYPCANCGREVGYGGRGRKPTANSLCPDCKPNAKRSNVKVTGAAATKAAQAAEVLTQLNAMFAMGAAALGLFETAGTLVSYQDTFKAQAYAALTTDMKLCESILKSGAKSSKVSLGMAYVGMGVAVGPTAVNEMRARKAERDARKAELEDDASGT
jgi:DNA-directed RNA polymerase subunit RPC12/RpoP